MTSVPTAASSRFRRQSLRVGSLGRAISTLSIEPTFSAAQLTALFNEGRSWSQRRTKSHGDTLGQDIAAALGPYSGDRDAARAPSGTSRGSGGTDYGMAPGAASHLIGPRSRSSGAVSSLVHALRRVSGSSGGVGDAGAGGDGTSAPLLGRGSRDDSTGASADTRKGSDATDGAGSGGVGPGGSGGRVAPTASFQRTAQEARAMRLSFRCLYAVSFLASIGFSILLPSLWPRLQKAGHTHSFYGVVLAMYCVGQIIGSITLGALVTRMGYRSVLTLSLVVEFTGYAIYVVTLNGSVILLSRLVAGIGAGNISLARAFIAANVGPKGRAAAMATVTAAQALGFVAGPVVASLLGMTGLNWGHYPLRFNDETLPGYTSGIMALANLLAISLAFTNARPAKPMKEASELQVTAAGDDGEDSMERGRAGSAGSRAGQPPAHYFGLVSCALLFMMELIVFSLGETVLVPLTQAYYGWDISTNGLVWAAVSGCATISFVTLRFVAKYFRSSLNMWKVGILLAIVCLLALCPWGVVSAGIKDPVALAGGPSLQPWRLVVFMCLMLGVAHPYAFVAMITMYSMLVPPGKQGVFMGTLQAFGSMGRIVGPIVAGRLLSLNPAAIGVGSFWLFLCTAVLLLCGFVFLAACATKVNNP